MIQDIIGQENYDMSMTTNCEHYIINLNGVLTCEKCKDEFAINRQTGRVELSSSPKKNKFHNIRCEDDDGKYASKKERRIWQEAKMRRKQGIDGLIAVAKQVDIQILPDLIYRADIIEIYNDGRGGGRIEVIDVKGGEVTKTDNYKTKKKILQEKFNITIKEV